MNETLRKNIVAFNRKRKLDEKGRNDLNKIVKLLAPLFGTIAALLPEQVKAILKEYGVGG